MMHKQNSLFILLVLILAGSLAGQSTDRPGCPYFHIQSDSSGIEDFPLESSQTSVEIAGTIANVIVQQRYRNRGMKTIEATYVFPGSTRAAIYGLEMRIGERVIVATIKERGEARKAYEEARTEGKRAVLLEQERPNVFTMSVANIAPGNVIDVTLRYTEVLVPESGVYTFVYPTVVGPRYASGNTGAPTDQFVEAPYTMSGDIIQTSISTSVLSATPISFIESPSHRVHTSFNGMRVAEVTLDSSEHSAGNRDYILRYSLRGQTVESGLLLYEHQDEKFFMLAVEPPDRIPEASIPPREFVFIVDISGSMRGYPLELSKSLIRKIITELRPVDRFNMLFFAGGSGWYSDTSVTATEAELSMALNTLENQHGGGGTEILEALEHAMSLPRAHANLSRSFVILTDGYVHVEKEALEIIRKNRNSANCFVFGIGSSVNRFLIDGMAHAGGGVPFVVTRPEEGPEAVGRFQTYVSTPVLTQLKLQVRGFDAYDVEPPSLADVSSERPLVIFGKYRGQLSGELSISGMSAEGPWNTTVTPAAFRADPRLNALRYLWAREKLRILSDFATVESEELVKQEIIDIGLKYHLLTKYTSFVAVDHQEVVDSAGQVTRVRQPLPLPQNVSQYAVGFDLAIDNSEESLILDKSHVSTRMDEAALVADMTITRSRPDITFILGQDGDPDNPYYALARRFYLDEAHRTTYLIDSCRTLEQVRSTLKTISQNKGVSWGQINLVAHGNAYTGMSVPVDSSGGRTSSRTLELNMPREMLPGIDRHTLIDVQGCALGQDASLIKALCTYFTGTEYPKVQASPLFVSYLRAELASGESTMVRQLYQPYFAFYKAGYRPGDIRLSRQFAKRYPGTAVNWRSVLESTNTDSSAEPRNYNFRVPVKWIVAYEDAPLPAVGTDELNLKWLMAQSALCAQLEAMGIPLNAFNWHIKPIKYRKGDGTLVPAIRAKGVSEIACVLVPAD